MSEFYVYRYFACMYVCAHRMVLDSHVPVWCVVVCVCLCGVVSMCVCLCICCLCVYVYVCACVFKLSSEQKRRCLVGSRGYANTGTDQVLGKGRMGQACDT